MKTPMIVNPHAGGGRCGQRAAGIAEKLRNTTFPDLEVHLTNGPRHATELAAKLADAGHDTILCAGGDGTTYEVVNGLFPRENERPRPKLGILPLGTGNSFLKDFGIETEEQAVEAVCQRQTHPVDVVRADHKSGAFHYVNLLSIGFTSDVGALTNRWFKALGPAGYAVSTVLEVMRLRARSFPVQLDGGPVDARPADFLSFSNSRCTGGDMQMAPYADVADGRLDVIRVGDLGRVGLLRAFPSIYKGTHVLHPHIESSQAARVDLDLAEAVDVMVDGEVLRAHLTALHVLPQALEVFA